MLEMMVGMSEYSDKERYLSSVNHELIANLKSLRKQSHINQTELAQKLNVSRQTISSWETGRNTPDAATLIRIADFYHVSLDQLVSHRKHLDKTRKIILVILFIILCVERITTNSTTPGLIWIDYLILVPMVLYLLLLLIDKGWLNAKVGLLIYTVCLFIFGIVGIASAIVNLFSMGFDFQITCFICGAIAIGYLTVLAVKHLIKKVKESTSLRA